MEIFIQFTFHRLVLIVDSIYCGRTLFQNVHFLNYLFWNIFLYIQSFLDNLLTTLFTATLLPVKPWVSGINKDIKIIFFKDLFEMIQRDRIQIFLFLLFFTIVNNKRKKSANFKTKSTHKSTSPLIGYSFPNTW